METIRMFSGEWAAKDLSLATDEPVATNGPTKKIISIKRDKNNPIKGFLPLCIGSPVKLRK